ncbi:Rne/Rng family ribonuclease [Jannaschia pohangensis]|uniref:Ribonuclease E n=1 Tax=Jannaschia pohangensis TaxID=390807 RepID=A0A1I3I5R6_9RHOB|nr:Rne/Rng family ribonuclease [Jannaschia pohangensis]SFI43219.1 RNAse E [Jannaschia pohangensis]
MAKKMLIDATHPEETRVVVADGNKVEEFDFESLNKRQLAGNIYLAKVTRVEPSLQAAFIDYGGNRHGFLAFSEIHPDYYQIPKADRDAILAEERAYAEAQAAADEAAGARASGRAAQNDDDGETAEADGEAEAPKKSRSRSRTRSRSKKKTELPEDQSAGTASVEGVAEGSSAEMSEAATEATSTASEAEDDDGPVTTIAEDTGLEDEIVTEGDAPEEDEDEAPARSEPSGMETVDLGEDEDEDASAPVEEPAPKKSRSRSRKKPTAKAAEADADSEITDNGVETIADDDAPEDIRPVRVPRPKARKYKIQEVVKVRQIMLVQVVKEERGNKGAALTTYLSLAGRYCVLMPNTARGGGISRKITNAADRKKLKEIAQEIDVPQGAGLIVRTAGAKRTKTEIKRDYEYLQRMWEQVRALTLKSIAPAPIYEEGNLIHRSIRDLYSREIDEVIVEGEAGYRDAKDYMKLIMPSHAKNVKLHDGRGQPLFAKHGVESYLASMFNPTVQLPSGGYIVIGITEALVAIDVNSGKATKEGSIEDTATKTNLEAATEVARQMKLRDLAGLIVIDFIDMDERKNNAAVEKRLKDALKHDRARIQVGRISGFGLLEMSRQRLRPGMLEATTQSCPHCHGTGLIRSDDSVALQILRALEEEGTRKRSREVLLKVPVDVCNYLMNEKREHLAGIEMRYDMAVRVVADAHMIAPDYSIEKFKTATRIVPKPSSVVQMDTAWSGDDEDEDDVVDAEADAADEAEAQALAEEQAETPAEAPRDEDGEDKPKRKRRRRSRRKKPGNGEGQDTRDDQGNGRDQASGDDDSAEPEAETTAEAEEAPAAEAPADKVEEAPKPKSRSRSRSRSKKSTEAETPSADTSEPAAEAEVADAPEEPAKAKPKSRSRARAKAPATVSDEVVEAAEAADSATAATPEPVVEQEAPAADEPPAAVAEEPAAEIQAADEAKPKRKGWWSFGS